MSIWEKLGFGGYKGFSHESDQLLRSAVELAGNLGCEKADTGHLLLAILQQDHGAAARFLAGQADPGTRGAPSAGARAAAHRLCIWTATLLRRTSSAPWITRIIGAQNAHLNRAEPEHLLCAMLEDDGCAARHPAGIHGRAAHRCRAGVPPAVRAVRTACIRCGPRSVRRAAAAPVISTAGI